MKKTLLTTILATMAFSQLKSPDVAMPSISNLPTKLNDYFIETDSISYMATPEKFFYNKNLREINKENPAAIPKKAKYLSQKRFWEITDSLYNKIDMPKEITKDLFWAFVKKESSFNTNSYNSLSGASGLTQMRSATWRDVDKKTSYVLERFTPEKSLENGLKYLKWIPGALKKMHSNFENLSENNKLKQIVASYNWGIGNIRDENWEFSQAPTETQNYYKFVTGEMLKKQ